MCALRTEFRVSHMLDKHSTTVLYPVFGVLEFGSSSVAQAGLQVLSAGMASICHVRASLMFICFTGHCESTWERLRHQYGQSSGRSASVHAWREAAAHSRISGSVCRSITPVWKDIQRE